MHGNGALSPRPGSWPTLFLGRCLLFDYSKLFPPKVTAEGRTARRPMPHRPWNSTSSEALAAMRANARPRSLCPPSLPTLAERSRGTAGPRELRDHWCPKPPKPFSSNSTKARADAWRPAPRAPRRRAPRPGRRSDERHGRAVAHRERVHAHGVPPARPLGHAEIGRMVDCHQPHSPGAHGCGPYQFDAVRGPRRRTRAVRLAKFASGSIATTRPKARSSVRTGW